MTEIDKSNFQVLSLGADGDEQEHSVKYVGLCECRKDRHDHYIIDLVNDEIDKARSYSVKFKGAPVGSCAPNGKDLKVHM